MSPEERRVFEEAAEDVGAQHAVSSKANYVDSFNVYSDEGTLLYAMHPRDAFITKMRLLEDARESKNVRVIYRRCRDVFPNRHISARFALL